jgi:hypothetical protein
VTQANVAPPWLRAAARAALALEADALLAPAEPKPRR